MTMEGGEHADRDRQPLLSRVISRRGGCRARPSAGVPSARARSRHRSPPSTQACAKMSISGSRQDRAHGASRQEVETLLRQLHAAFADQAAVQLGLQAVQEAHVAGRIILLRVAEIGRSPVGRLLLLAEFLPQQFADQFLQAMAIGVGADQARGDLGVVRGRCDPRRDNAGPRRYRSGRSDRASGGPDRRARLQVRRGIISLSGPKRTRCSSGPPSDSCTTHRRSRGVMRPMVSVSTAIDAPGAEDVGGEFFLVEVNGHAAAYAAPRRGSTINIVSPKHRDTRAPQR